MAVENQSLRTLLAGQLPLDRIGPQLRRAARRALHADDSERIHLVTKAVVGELLRRGDLLRVAVDQPAPEGASPRALFLLKDTNRVVDLSILGTEPLVCEIPSELRPVADAPGTSAQELGGVTGMLGAMEDAQDLEIGELHSGEKSVVLAGILRLLSKFTPQFRLYILLPEEETLPDDPGGVFQVLGEEFNQSWLSQRTAGQSVWIPSPAELPSPILSNLGAPGVTPFTATAAVAVPLWEPEAVREPDRAVGESGLFFVVARDEWGRETLLRLGDRLTRFVTRRWQSQWEVNQRIHTDSLTGAFNRAHFDKQFTLELERARRSNIPLTLILGDLDHFKQVNDNFGHQAGDVVLKMVAHRLQEELRRIDHICRIGGEEFGLILPDTGQEAAQEVALRLLDAPLTAETTHDGHLTELSVTLSFGAVTFPDAGADAFELYRKADAMQYLSKDLGRNQCHFWNSRGDHVQLLPSGLST